IALIASQEEDLLGDLFSGDGGGAAAAAREAGHEPQPPEQGAAHAQSAGPTPNAGGSEAAAEGPMPPAVPLARKLAKDHVLALRTLTPRAPHGTVRVKDVKEPIAATGAQRVGAESPSRSEPTPSQAAPSPDAAPPTGTVPAPAAPVVDAGPEELLGSARERRTRQLTARAMSTTPLIPQFTAFRAMDLSAAARARTEILKGISWTALLRRAYALLPRANARLTGARRGAGGT